MINKIINNIKNANKKSKYYNLLANKAYKTQNKYNLNNKNILIITPDKKMQ